MRIASYNIENIFHREATLLKQSMNRSLSKWMREFEDLKAQPRRTYENISRMRELSDLVGFQRSDRNPYCVMRRRGGGLYIQRNDYTVKGRASSLSNWNGWIELKSRPLDKTGIENKARVIEEVNPDILLLQEVEDRQSLSEFNRHYLNQYSRFEEIYVVPGNSQKGRDQGILLKKGYRITSFKSFSNLKDDEGEVVFDKDFQQYELITPSDKKLILLTVHLQDKEKDDSSSDIKRSYQIKKVLEIYRSLLCQGELNIILAGTFNTPSYSGEFAPLKESGLKGISRHRSFASDVDSGTLSTYYRMGGFAKGVNLKQEDYLLVSPSLFPRIRRAGLSRKGIWPHKKRQWEIFPTVEMERHQASAHPLLWGDLAI